MHHSSDSRENMRMALPVVTVLFEICANQETTFSISGALPCDDLSPCSLKSAQEGGGGAPRAIHESDAYSEQNVLCHTHLEVSRHRIRHRIQYGLVK